jgi:hypothetical protein
VPPGCEAPDSPYDIDDAAAGARGCSGRQYEKVLKSIKSEGRYKAA